MNVITTSYYVQQFELDLSADTLAQARYYQKQGTGSEHWSEILHDSRVDTPDNVSLHSCPLSEPLPLHYNFTQHHKRTKSACLPVRPPRSLRTLSNPVAATPASVSAYSISRPTSSPTPSSYSSVSPFTSRHSLTSSQPSLTPQSPPVPRPKSLYVPFVGCVDAPRVPPGQAARDILHAMSYAPTHESFSSDETHHITPISKLFKSPRLKSKSSSLVSLIGPVSPRMTRASGSTCSLVQLPISSSFSPNHPSNNCENSCLLMSHPPVIHPPPDLVQMTASSLPSQSARLMSSDNSHQSNLEMIRESSPYKPF